MDSFYPSVEIRENPVLKGKPVIVGADPKGGKGRGVVVSCSYEARKFGVRSAMPISRAYQVCPNAVYLPPNFELYGRASDEVMNILRGFSDRFEQVSIDEAFLEVSERVKEYGSPVKLALAIKDAVKKQTGLTCSIGVAPNKSVAKIASDMKKPDGLTIVSSEGVKEFLEPLPVTKISGVGKKSQETLGQLGIETIGQLAAVPGRVLTQHFGKNGVWLWAIANGVERVELQEEYVRKSIGAERTFEVDVADVNIIYQSLNSLAEEVYARLQTEKMLFKTVTLKIRFQGFETYTRARSHVTWTNSGDAIIEDLKMLYREFSQKPKKIRLLGARLSNLKEKEPQQATLQELFR